jgi:hypothetical protein
MVSSGDCERLGLPTLHDNQPYLARRAHLAGAVHDTVMAVSYPVRPVLRGSFCHSDFHLLTTGAATMSDVDLIIEGMDKHDRDDLANRISLALRATTGLTLNVSAHPRDTFYPLSRSDASFLAIGEFIRHIDEYVADSIAASFLYAKICLLVLRKQQAERYVNTGARIGTSEATRAVMVKLGLVQEFPVDAMLALLRTARSEEASLFARYCVERYPDKAFREWYVRSLRCRTRIDSWLRNYVADRVEAMIRAHAPVTWPPDTIPRSS